MIGLLSSAALLAAALTFSRVGLVVAQAQVAVPSNDTKSLGQSSGLVLTTSTQPTLGMRIEPLTAQVGLGLNPVILTFRGFLTPVSMSYQKSVLTTSIVYMPCDTGKFDGNLLNTTVLANPVCIVLYSLESEFCALQLNSGVADLRVFTVVGRNASTALQQKIVDQGSDPIFASIKTGLPTNTTGQDVPAPTTSVDPTTMIPVAGPAPTTQVAMIILYSITGLITGLFLIIIVTGAFRAHRHPERYGPRPVGRFGAMRQSRARGVARAVLDSIPIVKFGGNEPDEPKPDEDVEMNPGVSRRDGADKSKEKEKEKDKEKSKAEKPEETGEQEVDAVDAEVAAAAAAATAAAALATGSHEGESSKAADNEVVTDAATDEISPDMESADKKKNKAKALNIPGVEDNSSVCSICTEEFVKGDDQRLLPCNHAYHPACVDPWLLSNGTCPLCRIDLMHGQPSLFPIGFSEDAQEEETSQNPRMLSRMYSDMRRLSQAEPAERITALRRLRDQTRGLVASASPVPAFRRRSAAPGGAEEDQETSAEEDTSQRHRRTSRLSGVFRRGRRARDSTVVAAANSESGASSDDVATPERTPSSLIVSPQTPSNASLAVEPSAATAVPSHAARTSAQERSASPSREMSNSSQPDGSSSQAQ